MFKIINIFLALILGIELIEQGLGYLFQLEDSKYYPSPIHHYVDIIQLLLVVLMLARLSTYKKKERTKRRMIVSIMLFVCTIGVFELAFSFLLHNPRLIPKKLNSLFQVNYYLSRNIIQYSPSCTCYNKNLFYTLKPGNCNFNNIEFKTQYQINKRGLRDDETSLQSPEIIVLGDSYAMGWGVHQSETFAQIIEKRTKYKVLNAGVSSYGTARELKLLQNLDTRNLKYLVIQYHKNDFEENKSFFDKKQLEISSKQKYDQLVNLNNSKVYHPGRYFTRSLSYYLQRIKVKIFGAPNQIEKKDIAENEERYFFHALDKLLPEKLKNNKNLTILFIELPYNKSGQKDFKEYLQKKQKVVSSPYIQNMKVIAVGNNQLPSFTLDDHMNQVGHQKVANELIKHIK